MKFLYKNSFLLSDVEVENCAKTLSSYISQLKEVIVSKNYDAPESSINLPDDTKILDEVLEMKEKKWTRNLRYIFDIGIGGSNLGTKAIYDGLFGHFDILTPNRYPKMIFADTNDPEFLHSLVTFLTKEIHNEDEVLINVISKSGGTTETISNFEIIMSTLKRKFPEIEKQVVVTTDHGSKMYKTAEEKKIDILTLPASVGGRYSVFSAVGLFPLAMAGVSIKKLLQGARDMRELCTKDSLSDNPALVSAVTLFLQNKLGKNINDNFIFHPELESVGKWYRQLMGESVGKNGLGLTPTVSIGSVDLHSTVQLYLGGPKDKVTTFISTENNLQDVALPETLSFPLVDSIAGKKVSEIMKAILEGVKIAYAKQQLPYIEVVLDDVSEKSIGEFLQYKMIEMMYLGKLLDVNPFDQPEVELYKIETKKILAQ